MKRFPHVWLFVALVLVWCGRDGARVAASNIAQTAYNLVQQAGTPLNARATLNCSTGMSCTDDPVHSVTVMTAIGSGGSVTQVNTGCGTSGGPITSSGTVTGVGVCVTVPNASSTGTTLNKLAKLTGAPSTAVISGAGDTAGAIGIVDSGAGTAGSAVIQEHGQHSCVFDGATVAGHYVQISASTAGDCTDGGATYPTSGQVLGVVLSTNGGGGLYIVDMSLKQASVAAGIPYPGAGVPNSSGSAWNTSYNATTLTAFLNPFTSLLQGLAPASGGGTTNFLRADGNWAAPAGSGGTASRGTFGARPTCTVNGSTYYSTDIPVISECGGPPSWADWAFGRPVTLPSAVSFTWQNQGTASVSTNGVMAMVSPSNSGDNIHGQYISLPATPFTLDACFVTDMLTLNYNIGGLYVSDGTKLVLFGIGIGAGPTPPQINIQNYNSVTSNNGAAVTSQSWTGGAGQYCLRWNDDGTNVLFSTSLDGVNWTQFASLGRTAFLTPTRLGWAFDPNNTTRANAETLFHWLVH